MTCCPTQGGAVTRTGFVYSVYETWSPPTVKSRMARYSVGDPRSDDDERGPVVDGICSSLMPLSVAPWPRPDEDEGGAAGGVGKTHSSGLVRLSTISAGES